MLQNLCTVSQYIMYLIFLWISGSNWGTENDPEFKGYHNGNSEPRGFGAYYQISISNESFVWFYSLQVNFGYAWHLSVIKYF